MARRELFVPQITPGASPAVSKQISPLSNKGPSFMARAVDGYNNLPPETQQMVKAKASELAKSAGKKVVKTVGNKMRNRGSSDSSDGSSRKSNSGNFPLNSLPDPRPIGVTSGVRPRAFGSSFIRATENRCAPFHMTSAILRIPSETSSDLKAYFDQVVSYHLQAEAQDNVNFNVLQGGSFTQEKILKALNDTAQALQIYYYYSSIVYFADNCRNRSDAMTAISDLITPQMLLDLRTLKRKLCLIPFPPNFHEVIRYLAGTFSSGEASGSPLLKIAPIASSSTMVRTADIKNASTLLDDNDNENVFNLLRRAVSGWVLGELKDIPDYPLYDPNFLTVFANLPYVYRVAATNTNVPTVANNDESVLFNCYTGDLDGLFMSLISPYNSATASYVPGLMIPVVSAADTTSYNTRRSYYVSGGIRTWVATATIPFLNKARMETYYNGSDTNHSVLSGHLSGFEMLQYINGNSITETSIDVLEWMMSIDSVKQSRRNFRTK